jgi:hypothetical protein
MDKHIDYRHKYKKYKYKFNMLGGRDCPIDFKVITTTGEVVIHRWFFAEQQTSTKQLITDINNHPCIKNKINCIFVNGILKEEEELLKSIYKIYQLVYFKFMGEKAKNDGFDYNNITRHYSNLNGKYELQIKISKFVGM